MTEEISDRLFEIKNLLDKLESDFGIDLSNCLKFFGKEIVIRNVFLRNEMCEAIGELQFSFYENVAEIMAKLNGLLDNALEEEK